MREENSSQSGDPREGMNDPLPEGFDPNSVDIQEASEDLLWKVLPLMEGSRRAEALYVLGSRLARNQRWEQAVVCAEESIEEWDNADNSNGLVHGLLAAASCRSHLLDYEIAIGHYQRVIDLLATYGPESELVEAHARFGGVLVEVERFEEARMQYEAAMFLANPTEDPEQWAVLNHQMAAVSSCLDAPSETVLGFLTEARSAFAAAKDLTQVMDANDHLARHFDLRADYETSALYLEENLHLAKSLGKPEILGTAHYRYAGALRLCNRHEEAFSHIDSARAFLQETGDHERMLWCDLERLWCLQRVGRNKEAVDLLETLWVAVRIMGTAREMHAVVFDLYLDAMARGDIGAQEKICRQAMAWARDNDDAALVDRFLIELGLVHIDNTDWDSAAEIFDTIETANGQESGVRTVDTDALLQSAIAELALHRGDAASAAMALAGVAIEDTLPPHILARIHRTRGMINQQLVRGSGIMDLARAAQLWTNLGWRHLVSGTLDLLASADDPRSH